MPYKVILLLTCFATLAPAQQKSEVAPVLFIADGLDEAGSLAANYQRGLRYAIDYFGNHGDLPRIGKSAAFQKHMGLTLPEFYRRFDRFIRKSDAEVMKIF